jgi:glutamate-1-semialdehyde 2,1-aminomutase
MLVKAGSGVLTAGFSDSDGVPAQTSSDTLVAEYNDLESVAALLEANEGKVAAVIIEPVAANMGVVPPKEGFLRDLRELTKKFEVLLIFDEVITGFRLAKGGAQDYYGIDADIVVMGKIIGGGLPVGAYAAREEIMKCISPLGGVYQAGTLSGNPVAMAAGLAQLKVLTESPTIYDDLSRDSDILYTGIEKIIKDHGKSYQVNHVQSIGSLFFTETEVVDYNSATSSDADAFTRFFNYLLDHNIYIAPSPYEAMFVSAAHRSEEISRTLDVISEFFNQEDH